MSHGDYGHHGKVLYVDTEVSRGTVRRARKAGDSLWPINIVVCRGSSSSGAPGILGTPSLALADRLVHLFTWCLFRWFRNVFGSPDGSPFSLITSDQTELRREHDEGISKQTVILFWYFVMG